MTSRSISQWCDLLGPRHPTEGELHAIEATEGSCPRALVTTHLQPTLQLAHRGSLLQSVSRPAMACEFEVLLNENEYPSGIDRSIQALNTIERIETDLSVFRPQSQLSKVNQFGFKHPVYVGSSTLELVNLAIDANHWTEGAFDITAGSLSEAWGFLRRQGSMPTQEQIDRALATTGTKYIEVNQLDSTISLLRDGVRLNPGGIGKGYALDLAARQLQSDGIDHFMMHGGQSSIVACGNRKNGQFINGWTAALKHPWRPDEVLDTIILHDQALGTSGSGKQFFHVGGKRYSHLIDPRSGWPADQMMSVTVICRSGAVADALATALFILGPEASVEFCEAHPEISAVLVYTDPKSGSQRIERRNF